MDKKKDVNRNKYVKSEYLPTLLAEKLHQTVFADKKSYVPSKNNFLLCASIIFYYQVRNGIGIENYVPLASKYWKKVFGGNYHEKVIEPLLRKYKIIESHDFGYRTFPNLDSNPHRGKQNGQVGIRYRINQELMNDRFEYIDYIPRDRVRTALEHILADGKEFLIPEISDKSYRVSIDRVKAIKWVETNIEEICNEMLNTDFINDIPGTLKIQCKELVNLSGKWSYNLSYKSVSGAKLRAETHGKTLFYFKDSFYLADVKEFLNQRIELLKYNYKQHISKIGLHSIEEKQNPKTLRLYTDLTNFPSHILQFININSKTVVQLDLRTSQFLIFANLLNIYLKYGEHGLLKPFRSQRTLTYLKKLIGILEQHHNLLPEAGVDISDNTSGQYSNSDITKFIRDVFFKDFYAVIQQELGFSDRLLAKHVMFKLLFKRTNQPDALLNMLIERYHVVMSIIAEFKKRHDIEKKSTVKKKQYDER